MGVHYTNRSSNFRAKPNASLQLLLEAEAQRRL
jgi:hypothetical protein